MKKNVGMKRHILTIILVAILCVSITSYVFSSGSEIPIEKHSFIKLASCVIENDTGTIKAFDGQTGELRINASDFVTVWNYTRDNILTSERTWKEKVFIKGNFSIASPIVPYNYTSLEVVGEITLEDNADCNMLQTDPGAIVTAIEINGGVFDGNSANQAAGDGFYFWAEDVLIRNVDVIDCKGSGIDIHGAGAKTIRLNKVNVDECEYGLSLNATDVTVTSSHFESNEIGIYLNQSSYNMIDDNIFRDDTNSSLYFAGTSIENTITSNQMAGTSNWTIYIQANSEDNIITSNHLHGSFANSTGIYVLGDDNHIIGNVIGDHNSSIIVGAYDTTIEGNHFKDCTIGVLIQTTANATEVDDNCMVHNVTTPIIDNGLYSITVENDGFNPIGLLATPFNDELQTVGSGGNTSAVADDVNYTITGFNIWVTCEDIDPNVDIDFYDAKGNLIFSDTDPTWIYLTRGFIINFDYSVATPEPKIYGD